jgi:hypothetical protein
MAQPDFFSLFLHPLNSINARYMITGAVASTIYGEPRLTQDIDVVLDLDRSGVPRLTAAFPADQYYVPPEEALEEEVGRRHSTSFLNRGLLRSGSKVGSIRSQPGET